MRSRKGDQRNGVRYTNPILRHNTMKKEALYSVYVTAWLSVSAGVACKMYDSLDSLTGNRAGVAATGERAPSLSLFSRSNVRCNRKGVCLMILRPRIKGLEASASSAFRNKFIPILMLDKPVQI